MRGKIGLGVAVAIDMAMAMPTKSEESSDVWFPPLQTLLDRQKHNIRKPERHARRAVRAERKRRQRGRMAR